VLLLSSNEKCAFHQNRLEHPYVVAEKSLRKKEKSEPLRSGSLYVKSLLTLVAGGGEMAPVAGSVVNQTSGTVAFSDLICSDTR